ncbi:SnoaL-like domain-containing protein [Chryseolinea serpens]|uniref:SnoaL-like domain-containing protein n=1 Tax=Chryseolinea serpens TaxID=947013 RepID=A0A1M5WIG4_9BACT|nr:nuclear transport factor 2 family protein [Chryseolinea serpens]SHH87271.1 SnoaL-like domain-containing protein [Chryseolinea serpens]
MKVRRSFVLCMIFLSACTDRKQGIENAMKKYDRLILHVDADSIADCFMPDGKLGTVSGRDSIRAFLKRFGDVKVLQQRSSTTAIAMKGDSARQDGTYFQEVILNGDTITATGKYTASWVWDGAQGWLLENMVNVPDKK